MAGKTKDSEFRHPNTAAHMQGLTDEEAAKHPPVVREAGGVFTEHWREGGRVRCREVGEPSRVGAPELGALLAAAEAAFGRSLPRMRAELRGGRVPDLDALETTVRDGMLGSGARGCAALLEALDAELPAPPCPDCGRRMERQGRIGKTLPARLGQAGIKRRHCRCRECGGGRFPLDRALGLEGKAAAPGAESVCADAAGSDSCAEASRKLGNLAGVRVPKSTLQRCGARIGQEMQEFERADAGKRKPPAKRVLVGIDGTGVPTAAGEVEGVPGKQEDGAAKTREAKAIVPARPKAGTRRPGSRGRTGAAGLPASASTAHGRKAASAGRRSSRGALSGSGSGRACSRPKSWSCCPTGRHGSGTSARRSSPARGRPSSSTSSMPSIARRRRCGSSLQAGPGGRRGWRGSRRN